MEGVNSEGVGVPDADRLQPEVPQSNNVPVPSAAEERIDFDAEAEALAEEEASDVPVEQDDIDELDEALTPGPEREDQDFRMPLCGRRKGTPSGPKRLVKKDAPARPAITPQQRLLLLDTWQRSGLPANDLDRKSVV